MLIIKEYVKPKSIEEAYNILVSREKAEIIGGAAFVRLSNKTINVGIDLYDAGLDFIREDNDYIEIGSMVTISQFEDNQALSQLFNGFLKKISETILSYQMRNIITVGGTLYPKYGFSDLITGLLVLNTEVKLYKSGILNLETFLKDKPRIKDILESIKIKKEPIKTSFKYIRNSEYDFSILNVAVSIKNVNVKIAVGSRPGVATLAYDAMGFLNENGISRENIEKAAEIASTEINFADDMKASADYRREVCKVLVKRALLEVAE
ncbi:FAD binding domain-containing protein [Thermosipho ferrireducens]|uniref:FAD binding domain-containing protein n=1 Tax=Thermosipho ferrireducens TaxID=2571116 RepID=A0ABX7S462_9BACT|nr:FAD binding domain-containing protein [Thermosipho ferrireducens]QTA37204.1 FAD binding domain-containing protein [Thermosipho ferrireducens]